MAILLEILKKSLSDPRSSPLGTTSIGSHPGEERWCRWGVKEGKVAGRIESSRRARKTRRMSQSSDPPSSLQPSESSSRHPHSPRARQGICTSVAWVRYRARFDGYFLLRYLLVFSLVSFPLVVQSRSTTGVKGSFSRGWRGVMRSLNSAESVPQILIQTALL